MDEKNDLKTKINYLFSLKNKVKKVKIEEFTPRTINYHNNEQSSEEKKLSEEEQKEDNLIKTAVRNIKNTYKVIEDEQKNEESEIVNQMKETKVPCNDLIRVIKFSEREIIPCSGLFDDIMDLK